MLTTPGIGDVYRNFTLFLDISHRRWPWWIHLLPLYWSKRRSGEVQADRMTCT